MSSIDSACRRAHQPKISLGIRAALLSAFVAALMLASGATPAQRDCCEGDWWQKWNRGQRETYFYGYAAGYSHGFMYGCERGTEHWPVEWMGNENDPLVKCLAAEQRDFSKSEAYFLKGVTEFYKGHPEVRDINPYEVIDLLAKGLSVEEIRAYPFMRHNPTSANPGRSRTPE